MFIPSHSLFRRRALIFALTFAFAALISIGAPGRARAGITDAVKTETLPNGLKVLVLENHKAPVATFNLFTKVGSRNESFGKTGISHLVEHLKFRGTKKYGPEEFSNIIQENGGMDNAFTGADFTDYFEVINRDHLDVPIGLEADRMANFDPKGFDSELAVVEEERRMRTDDNPEDALSEATQAQAFVEHPYHWPVIGWMQDIQRLTLADALKYHSVYYSPQNAIVVAVGDFDADKVLKQIAESFGPIKNGPKPPPVLEVEPPQQGERNIVLRHAANLPAFSEAYHVPNYRVGGADAFALEIASEILSDGKSSRLYNDGARQADGGRGVGQLRHDVVRSRTVRALRADAPRGEDRRRDRGSQQGGRAAQGRAGRRGRIAEGQEPRAVVIRVRAGLDLRGGAAARRVGDAGQLPSDGPLPDGNRQGHRGRRPAGGEEIPGREQLHGRRADADRHPAA